MKYRKNCQKVTQNHAVSKHCWKNSTNRPSQYRIATNLQFVKNVVSMKFNKVKLNKMRYACIISNKINGRLKNYSLNSFETEGTSSVKQQGNIFFYFITIIFTVLIILILNLKSVPLTLMLFGGIACLMSAVNNVITSVVPLYSRDKIDSGFSAGLLNTFCYIGSTLATSMLGKIADTKGWNDVFICILIFTAVSFVVCFVSAALNKKAKINKGI